MYKTYRPKASNVKALQLTEDTAKFIANWCNGIVVIPTGEKLEVKVPTLEGPRELLLDEYLVRTPDKGFVIMSKEKFEADYEPVRNTRSKED